MRSLRERDYEEMADRVVNRFMQGTKLADGAVDEAMQGQLNPDQIERLVQAANTMAFLRLMDVRKSEGAPDLTHEFEPIDTRSVLQSIIGMGPDLQEARGAPRTEMESDDLPDEMQAIHNGNEPEQDAPIQDDEGPFPRGKAQKDKEERDDHAGKRPAKATDKDSKKTAMVRNRQLSKLATVFDDRLIEAELDFSDTYERLARTFKLASGAPTFERFEKDAMATAGNPYGLAVLNLMRQARNLPALEPEALEKCAQLNDRHVVEDYPALREFCRLAKITEQAVRIKAGAQHVRSLCV